MVVKYIVFEAVQFITFNTQIDISLAISILRFYLMVIKIISNIKLLIFFA